MTPILFIAAFLGLCAVAAATDIARMTIPNWVSIALAALFPVAAFTIGQPVTHIGWHLAFGLLILALCFGLFSVGVFGGGDAKLIPAIAVWTGGETFLHFALGMTLAGGALALALLAARTTFAPAEGRPAFLNRLLSKERGAPYAVAIFVGALNAAPRLFAGA